VTSDQLPVIKRGLKRLPCPTGENYFRNAIAAT
jgi:hypothetical protein